MIQQENFLLNLPWGCKEQPHYTSLGHSFCNTVAHMEAPPTSRGGSRGALGAQPPLTTKNEAPAPKFYKIEAPEWQF